MTLLWMEDLICIHAGRAKRRSLSADDLASRHQPQ